MSDLMLGRVVWLKYLDTRSLVLDVHIEGIMCWHYDTSVVMVATEQKSKLVVGTIGREVEMT